MKFTYLYILLSLFLFASCSDLLTKEIEFEDVGFESLLVLNSHVEPTENQVQISLTKNIPLSEVDDKNYKLIKDADVKFLVDNVSYDVQSVENPESIYGYKVALPSDLDLIGKKVKITASKESYKDILAETNVPKDFKINEIKYQEKVINKDGGNLLDRLRFTIEDNANEENYYDFKVLVVTKDTITLPDGEIKITDNFIGISLEREVESPIGNEVQTALSDRNFNGLNYTLSFALNTSAFPSEKKFELILVSTSLSKSAFLHATSVKKYQSNKGFGFFSEPVSIYSNVENGLGALTAKNSKIYKLK